MLAIYPKKKTSLSKDVFIDIPLTWYVPSLISNFNLDYLNISHVYMDGDELEHVRKIFGNNIPIGKTVWVYGDLAINIVANLNNI